MEKQSWAERNPDKIALHKRKYYENNREESKLRSRKQNLKGKIAYSMLSNSDKKKCDKEVEKLLTSDI